MPPISGAIKIKRVMILSLKVKNFLLVESASLEFSPGLNVLTGETGAGKSLLLRAISYALGERIDWDAFGEERATIELVLRIPEEQRQLVEEYGIDMEDDLLIIRRVIEGKKRRSRIYANDTLVVARTINEIARNIIEIQGQYDTYRLFDEDYHLELLDRFAKSRVFTDEYQTSIIDKFARNQDLMEEYRNLYRRWMELRRKLDQLVENEQKYIQELDYLRYQLEELEKANLREGEEEELSRKLEYLSRIEQIRAVLDATRLLYEGENSPYDAISSVLRDMEELSSIDEFAQLYERLSAVRDELKDIALSLPEVEMPEENLDEIQERLFFLSRLKKKYGKSISELIEYMSDLRKKIEELESAPINREKLERELQETRKKLEELAEKISRRRREAARKFEEMVMEHLRDLALEEAIFRVNFVETDLSPWGKEKVNFLFSSSPKFPPRPLKKVASGGELSRLALAIKLIMAGEETPSVLIFDEIDTGIGGETAIKVGRKLKSLSDYYQLIVITHLPQIASFADRHFVVRKSGARTTIGMVEGQERVKEIARMLSGVVSKDSMRAARELLGEVASK